MIKSKHVLSVREIRKEEIRLIADYFFALDKLHLCSMGVDPNKLHRLRDRLEMLQGNFDDPYSRKELFYVLWELEGVPVGHSNIANIVYGEEAYMHLHLWRPETRRRGYGRRFVLDSVKMYFEKFELKRVYCQPYARNPAPNRTLAKTGFELLESFETTPGAINFHQTVNNWVLTRERFVETCEGWNSGS